VLKAIARKLGHQRWFARLFRWVVPVDRTLARLTGGRLVGYGVVPTLLLTTTGRRSGRPHTSPLLYVTDGDAYVVVGSNWGRPDQPAWALNLRADPAATATVDRRRIPVLARLAAGAERERLWGLLVHEWPPYETYRRRAGGRDLMVFRLEPR
jgi:deazaflavin-dependent oxidoreductase (nitroreductase family)